MKAGNGTMLDAGVDLRDQTEPDAGTEQQPPSRERHARTPPAALRKCARCLRKDHSTSSPVPIYPAARESSAAKRRNPSIRLAHRSAARYGSWHVARLLADEGAAVDKLWQAAALGKLDRLEALLQSGSTHDQISQAFWHACAASQRRAAERLLNAGADLDWTPDYADGTPLDAAKGKPTRQGNVIGWLLKQGATSATSDD